MTLPLLSVLIDNICISMRFNRMAVVPRRSLPVTWENPGKRLIVLEGGEVEAL